MIKTNRNLFILYYTPFAKICLERCIFVWPGYLFYFFFGNFGGNVYENGGGNGRETRIRRPDEMIRTLYRSTQVRYAYAAIVAPGGRNRFGRAGAVPRRRLPVAR